MFFVKEPPFDLDDVEVVESNAELPLDNVDWEKDGKDSEVGKDG